MSLPNRAQDPKRQASYVVKEPRTAWGKKRLLKKQAAQGYEALKSLKKPRSLNEQAGPSKTPKQVHEEYNPISKTDVKVSRSGAAGAFKKMGMKTPIERAQERNRRPGKPPLSGF